MRRKRRQTKKFSDTMALAGWLFADLLLGLAMLFLVSNTVGTPVPATPVPPSDTPTPTTTPTATLTPTPTSTATATPTMTPTPTPSPTTTSSRTATPTRTFTPSPTYTPILTPTPYPTYTPRATSTPYPTYTPKPTQTGLPTYTPYPTPVPTQPSGLDQEAVILTIPPAGDKVSEIEDKFKDESRRAGFVLVFGYDPNPETGNELAREVKALLLEQVPEVFNEEWTVFEDDLHYLTENPEKIGRVDVKVYFLLGGP